jgi:hypothetical protein
MSPELPNPSPYQPPQQPSQPAQPSPTPNQTPPSGQMPPQPPPQQTPQHPSQQPGQPLRLPPNMPTGQELPPGAYQVKPRKWLKWTGIILMIIVIIGIGVLLWLGKPEKECLNVSNYLFSIKNIFKKPTLGELQAKSKQITNYQVDISAEHMSQTMLIKDNKSKMITSYSLSLSQDIINSPLYSKLLSQQTEMVYYSDKDQNKYYSYLPKYNIYSEINGITESDMLMDNYISGPLNSKEATVAESKEKIDNKMAYKFSVEAGEYASRENWNLWLWSCNGLPLKMQQYATEFTYKYSRLGEITDSEVTLPANAKKSTTPFFD